MIQEIAQRLELDTHLVDDFHESDKRQKFYLAKIPVQYNVTVFEFTILSDHRLVRNLMANINCQTLDLLTDRQSEKTDPNFFFTKL